MALTLQHGLTEVIRRRAPLDDSVDPDVAAGLEQGDWLKVVSGTGLYTVPNVYGLTALDDRMAWPIIIEPTQPDAVAAGMAVAFGFHSGQTDRFAPTDGGNIFVGHIIGDTPAGSVAYVNAYGTGRLLHVAGFTAVPEGGSAPGALAYGLVPSASAVEEAAAVAYVERSPLDNNGLLQYVVF